MSRFDSKVAKSQKSPEEAEENQPAIPAAVVKWAVEATPEWPEEAQTEWPEEAQKGWPGEVQQGWPGEAQQGWPGEARWCLKRAAKSEQVTAPAAATTFPARKSPKQQYIQPQKRFKL